MDSFLCSGLIGFTFLIPILSPILVISEFSGTLRIFSTCHRHVTDCRKGAVIIRRIRMLVYTTVYYSNYKIAPFLAQLPRWGKSLQSHEKLKNLDTGLNL